MKSIKFLLTIALMIAVGIGVAISIPDSVFATGNKGGWAIITDRSVRWVAYPGSNGELLYDRETGLIWEQAASTTDYDDWFAASSACFNHEFEVNGKRVRGFRLPTAAELSNLSRDISAVIDNIRASFQQSGLFFDYYYLTSELVNFNGTPGVMAVRFFSVNLSSELRGFPTLVPTNGDVNNPNGFFRALCVRGPGGATSGSASN